MFGTSGTKDGEGEQEGNPPSTSPTTQESVPEDATSPPSLTLEPAAAAPVSKTTEEPTAGGKRGGLAPGKTAGEPAGGSEKKRRSSGVGHKASSLIASAKHSLNFGSSSSHREQNTQTPLQKLGKQDPALSVPQGQHNNSAGESHPGPRSTFKVGVWEDRNKKCRRTMEDTHAFLYNFLHTPAPVLKSEGQLESSTSLSKESSKSKAESTPSESSGSLGQSTSSTDMMETDNGYFAIFDGHAGTFAADWCGKKLHIILEEMIRKNPNTPIPELLDQTFTSVDAQLEKLPLKNSGCTAVTAVLRWEDRIPNAQSATGSTAIAPATVAAVKAIEEASKEDTTKDSEAESEKSIAQAPNPAASLVASSQDKPSTTEATHAKLKSTATRARVLYTANVGDARIVLCRNGKALRLSYDHKGSDENEGKRIANAGGLILNNRVNGVLAVTRALGDAYMKDLVTGHPYTTETVIQPDLDEFIILACDGLWDVCSDQEAVDLVRKTTDPVIGSKQLVDHALARFSTDNLSCMIVRFNKSALLDTLTSPASAVGVEGDPTFVAGKPSEADKIVGDAKRAVQEGDIPAVGVSGSNSGKGHDPPVVAGGEAGGEEVPEGEEEERKGRGSMEKVVEEEGPKGEVQ